MLRVRLILWYSLLVVLTIVGVGLVQNIIIQRSLIAALDTSLLDDAQITLKLISTLPPRTDLATMAQHGTVRASGSLRDLVDNALRTLPDTLSGTDLADRVVSKLIDQILMELSFQDSTGRSIDPLDAIVERTVSSTRNNLVEIYALPDGADWRTQRVSFFRTANLGSDTLARRVARSSETAGLDSLARMGSIKLHGVQVRVARARNERFIVFVGYPVTDIEESLGSLRNSFYYLIPLALLVSILGGLLLARKALRPVEQIADTARDISVKNLEQRIQLPGRTDRELGILVRTLNSMFARLETSFQQVTQFTSDASHELKTPLAIMKGEIEQAQRHMDRVAGTDGATVRSPDISTLSPAEAHAVLASLMEEVERMQRIVEGLLMLSRADDKKLPLQLEPIRIYEFIATICEDAAILAEDRGLELKADLSETAREAQITADPTRLYQVLMNLLDNALKYTPSPGVVTLFLDLTGDQVQFGVADTGIGIDPDDFEHIFQRFFRTDEARSGPREDSDRSLGLGLAIVKSIVESHGGAVTVQSKPGSGTRFIITLAVRKHSDQTYLRKVNSV